MQVESSGFEDVIFQSRIYLSGRLNGVIKRIQYNRAWFIHSIFSGALEQLLVTRFLVEVIKFIIKKVQVMRNWFLFLARLRGGGGARGRGVEHLPPPLKSFSLLQKNDFKYDHEIQAVMNILVTQGPILGIFWSRDTFSLHSESTQAAEGRVLFKARSRVKNMQGRGPLMTSGF